jgi:prepilin-type N-terminal cleavage/methylation domain-containing protein
MSNRRGFTLIELIIVVMVIGVLASLGISRYYMDAHKSKEKEAELILKQVFASQNTYFAQLGTYATTVDQLRTVGFEVPSAPRHYVWAGSVDLPLCLASTGFHNGRQIDVNGTIYNC